MTTKVFTNFRAPVNSYPLGEMNLGLSVPGRYSGFDVISGVSLSIKLEHSGRVKKSSVSTSGVINEIIFGALLMPNGCTVHNETAPGEGIDLVIDTNTGNANPRYDLIVCEHEYVQVEGGIPPIYFVQKGANDGLVPALAIPKKQVIIGIMKIEANGNSFGSLTYTKGQVPIQGDNTDEEFIENIGLNTLFNQFGIQKAITNNPLIFNNSSIGVADDKVLQITKPATGSTDSRFYGVFKFEHLATQVAGTLKAWLGISSVTNGLSLFKFLVGSTIFEDTANSKGIAYATDYSAEFDINDRSIPDVGWIRNQIPTSTVNSLVVRITSWTKDNQYTASTGLSAEKRIVSITAYLECTTAHAGFQIGDIVLPTTPEVDDSGGLPAHGMGAQFKATVPGSFHVMVSPNIYYMEAWTSDGSVAGPIVMGLESQWALRFVILYTDN